MTGRKLRPAVVVAAGDHCDDIILCQITSQDYGDREAVAIDPIKDFSSGSLAKDSYVRPRKLFTANDRLIARVVGKLKPISSMKSLKRISKPSVATEDKQDAVHLVERSPLLRA